MNYFSLRQPFEPEPLPRPHTHLNQRSFCKLKAKNKIDMNSSKPEPIVKAFIIKQNNNRSLDFKTHHHEVQLLHRCLKKSSFSCHSQQGEMQKKNGSFHNTKLKASLQKSNRHANPFNLIFDQQKGNLPFERLPKKSYHFVRKNNPNKKLYKKTNLWDYAGQSFVWKEFTVANKSRTLQKQQNYSNRNRKIVTAGSQRSSERSIQPRPVTGQLTKAKDMAACNLKDQLVVYLNELDPSQQSQRISAIRQKKSKKRILTRTPSPHKNWSLEKNKNLQLVDNETLQPNQTTEQSEEGNSYYLKTLNY